MRAARTLPELFAATDDPPIERIALLIACDHDPRLDVERAVARIDDLAAPVTQRLRRVEGASAQAAVLGTYVFDELGLRGNDDDYHDPRNSDLNAVFETRRGIPITLAVALIAIARRAGVTAEGVGFPGHFLARVGDAPGVLLDPFFGGRIVNRKVLDELARRTLGGPEKLRPEHLAPVGPRAIAARMLTNLKGIHEARGDHARALVVCDRLVDLVGAPEHRRDRAKHSLALGVRATAAEDLAAYLQARPNAPDLAEMRALLASARATAKPRALQ